MILTLIIVGALAYLLVGVGFVTELCDGSPLPEKLVLVVLDYTARSVVVVLWLPIAAGAALLKLGRTIFASL